MRALALGLFLLLGAACSSGGTSMCTSTTCPGCCDSSGTCKAGTEDSACGANANACTACSGGATCTNKACSGGSGGGTASSGGGTAATGGGSGATGGGTAATGGGSGSTGGGSGSTGGGSSISNPGVDAGNMTFSPPHVQIDFPASCPLTACGGALAGTYYYTAACIPSGEFDTFTTQLEGVCGAGTVHVTSIDGGMQGYVLVQGTAALRHVTGDVTVKAYVTGLCVQGCSAVGSGISQGGYTGGCFVDAGVCDCHATKAIAIADNGQFAKSSNGNDITFLGSQKTFEYCTNGEMTMTRELDAGTTEREPGVATLTHQN